MSHARPAVLLSLLAALGVTAPAFPGSPEITVVGERLVVQLVEVDLWAEDESGGPVHDLRQQELRLEVDSRDAGITHFQAWESARAGLSGGIAGPSAGAFRPSATDGGATVAILFDDASLDPGPRERVAQAIAAWLAKEAPEDLWVLVALHGRSLVNLVPRTRDHRRARRALEDLPLAGAFAPQRALRERRVIEEIHEFQRLALTGPLGGAEPPCSRSFLRFADAFAEEVEREARATLWSVARLSELLAAVPGRKFLLFVTAGVPLRPGGSVFDFIRTLCDGSGAREGIQWAIDVNAGADISQSLPKPKDPSQLDAPALAFAGNGRDLSRVAESVTALANSSRVTIWPLSARGLGVQGADVVSAARTLTGVSRFHQDAGASDQLSAIAAATGGRETIDRNDFAAALGERIDDLAGGYTLAFTPSDVDERSNHRIRLTTTRPGIRLRYRQSWRGSSPAETLAANVRSAAMLTLERPALGAQLTLVERRPLPAGGARALLRLKVQADRVTLLPDTDGRRYGRLQIAIALVPGVEGGSIEVRSRELPVVLEGSEAAPDEQIVHDFDLPLHAAVATTLVVGVRDELSRELALLRLEIPAL